MTIRVYELAIDLRVTSGQLLRAAPWYGLPLRTMTSLVDADSEARLRKHFATRHNVTSRPRPQWGWDEYGDPLPDPGDLLTAAAAARSFGLSAATIRKWVSRGYLSRTDTAGRTARYRRDDLERARDRARGRRKSSPRAFPTPRYQRPITALEAAAVAGVSPSTIRMWVKRGHLSPVGKDSRRHLFDPMDVLKTARR